MSEDGIPEVPEGARLVPLTKGKYAIVDEDDYDRVMAAGPWNYLVSGGGGRRPYAVGPGLVRLHRFVLGVDKGDRRQVDHINGDTLDNRKSNLRVATPKENAANRGRTRRNRSGYKGVRLTPNGRWRAEVCLRGKTNPHHVGMFDTAEEAARARDEFVRKHKDPSTERFNFPRPGERGLDGKLVPLPIPAQRSEEPSLCSPSACGSCPLNGLCGDPADLPPELPDVDPREPRPEGSLCCGGACGS